ncbi:helix-turn-helix domain-containing protein [Chelativorans sp. Marseille-P2723]|uniref:winged helix-turn-helix transcriptional regulator n=1 Tax=Chelativorans sp. Marseille-P2723 TaxID=2709133 RepID=UPI00156DB186|nr:helix-turn-helix domain-containing protein [Chelativorans sp. Marseille-P2723]
MKPGNLDATIRVEAPTRSGRSERPYQVDTCRPIHEILKLVGDKWTILVVHHLGGGTMRFSALKRAIDGISQKMLTTTLRNLERDGFVTRTVHPTIPPKVEYELTGLGHGLLEPVNAMSAWAIENRERIEEARQRFDRQQARRSRSRAE